MKGKLQRFSVVGILLLVIALVLPLFACAPASTPAKPAAPAPAPAAAPVAAPVPAPAVTAPAAKPSAPAPAGQKTITLAYEFWLPSNSSDFQPPSAFFKGLEQATGGAVKTQFYAGGTMGSGNDTYQRTLNGVNDIGHFMPGYTPGLFPLFDVFTNPLRYKTGEELTKAVLQMVEKKYFDKELANVKFIATRASDPSVLYLTKAKVTKIADMKGLKIRTSSEGWSALTKALGAIPVSVPTGDVYVMMQKGTLDGNFMVWSGVRSYKMGEVAKFANTAPWLSSTHLIAMNKDTWNKLPQSAKDYIDKGWKQLSLDMAKALDKDKPTMQKMFKDAGGQEIDFEAGEFDKADPLFAPIWKNWVAEREAKGLPVKELLKGLTEVMTGLGIQKPIVGYTP